MAEKKKKKPAQAGFMIRLPEWHREPLERLKAKYRRPTTSEVQIALENHYKAEGVTPSGK